MYTYINIHYYKLFGLLFNIVHRTRVLFFGYILYYKLYLLNLKKKTPRKIPKIQVPSYISNVFYNCQIGFNNHI